MARPPNPPGSFELSCKRKIRSISGRRLIDFLDHCRARPRFAPRVAKAFIDDGKEPLSLEHSTNGRFGEWGA
jgi:hypothetical protein